MSIIESYEEEEADIYDDQGNLVGNVIVDLYVVQEKVLKSWSGNFQQTEGLPFLSVGNLYKIKLSNGKTGDFFVKGMHSNNTGFVLYSFKGTGPLE